MALSDGVRRIGFYSLDILSGAKCIKHKKDIEKKYGDSAYSDEEQLRKILQYAIDNVPFYSSIKEPRLELFPVVNKTTYQTEKENCFSKEFAEKEKLHKVTTSGSTGQPTVVYQDKGKRNRVKMDLILAHEKVGWKLGDRYVFLRDWASQYDGAKLKRILQNYHPVSTGKFDDNGKEELLKYLQKNKNTVLFGYSSSTVDFANYIIENNKPIPKLKLIICDSDELTKSGRKKLEEVFKCPVYSRYDNEENGLLAMDAGDGTFYVNYPSLHIELLKIDSDDPADPGEIGRVVVTDLFNRAMPIIRYDIGDLAVSDDAPGKIRTIRELNGRSGGRCYSPSGIVITNAMFSTNFLSFRNLKRYQFIQDDDKYTLKYDGDLSEEEMNRVKTFLRKLLGENTSIVIEKCKLEKNKNGKFVGMINNTLN